MQAIKIICRIEQDRFHQEIQNPLADAEMQKYALLFLNAFSPEHLLRKLAEQTGQNAVLVFRTSDTQMKRFYEAFHLSKISKKPPPSKAGDELRPPLDNY